LPSNWLVYRPQLAFVRRAPCVTLLLMLSTGLAHAQATETPAPALGVPEPTPQPPTPAPTPEPGATPEPVPPAPPAATTTPEPATRPAPPVEHSSSPSPAEPSSVRIDWADGPFPRATTIVELGAYAGTRSSKNPNEAGFEAGGHIKTCVLCIYTNDSRFVIGDYQTLRVGVGTAVLAEGLQLGYGINRDIDVVARGYYQWYRGNIAIRDGTVLGAAARWTRFTAGVAVGIGGEAYVGARLRVMLDRVWGLHAFFDRITGEGVGVGSSSSLRLAAVLSL
jgi:hypothetical protein